MNKEIKHCCNTCKHGSHDCETLSGNPEYPKTLEAAFKFKSSFVCDAYECRYIEYPIEVSEINTNTNVFTLRESAIGKFVKIKVCSNDKTYLGLFLGELPNGIKVSHNNETKVLNLGYMGNPAIFVFDLNKIVYGCESWWGVIENESDLREITDADIDNIWYVKALKSITESEEQNG